MAEDIERFVRGGDTVDRAARRLEGYGLPSEMVAEARRIYEVRIGVIRDLRDPRSLLETRLRTGGWYSGPLADDIFWPPFRDRLSASGLDADAVGSIDRASSRIVSLLQSPGEEQIRTRGLVLGYVQSGKTTSFMSVIAKAADAGYRMFIVLSGITDSLRSQTQARLDEVLVGDQRARWHWLTEPDRDFNTKPLNAPNLLRDGASRLIAVVKKNPYRLRRLRQFLDGAGDQILGQCPILLIDDEADQASIDVGTRGRQTRINSLIRQILGNPKAAYVAYTATPFANLLINPEDYEGLYPRHFIVDLDRPPNYFGTERIFGRDLLEADDSEVSDGLDVIRHVLDDEMESVRPPGRRAIDTWSADVPDSLAAAVRWFLLATAARRVRDGRDRHSTMLVHTSMLTAAHQRVAAEIGGYLTFLHRAIADADATVMDLLRSQWDEETARVPAADEGLEPVGWQAVVDRLPEVSAAAQRVLIDNHQSSDRLNYRPDAPTTAVVVGGNTLSRGLTLEGLICSYFVRSATAYDTLLQMGRWFGYRPGYSDLVRVWMTAELEGWFFDLATVEAEIRQQIRAYEDEGMTPDQLPVKIRTHPAMIVTSAAKMRHAVDAEVSFGGSRRQTILFNHRDPDWLRHNVDATARLLSAAAGGGSTPEPRPGRFVLTGVPVDLVTGFLNDYRFHPDAQTMRADLLIRYIELQNRYRALTTWNVVVMSDPKGEKGAVDLGPVRANMIQRSRLQMPNIAHANIKSLVSRVDRVADIDTGRAGIAQNLSSETDARLTDLRSDLIGNTGLLCIYPIARDSEPRVSGTPRPGGSLVVRVPLDAVDDVIGVGLFFPRDVAGQALSYKSADLSNLALETDEPDLDQLDAADEEADLAHEDSAAPARRKRR